MSAPARSIDLKCSLLLRVTLFALLICVLASALVLHQARTRIRDHVERSGATPETRLQWAWKVDTLPAEAPEDVAITHDYLSIAVEFDNGQDLTYMWSRALPVAHAFRCPLEGWHHRETHLVVRSGTGELGRWLTETRNVYEDYVRAVGGPPPERVLRVWLIANSIFGRREGRALFGDTRLGDGARLEPVW